MWRGVGGLAFVVLMLGASAAASPPTEPDDGLLGPSQVARAFAKTPTTLYFAGDGSFGGVGKPYGNPFSVDRDTGLLQRSARINATVAGAVSDGAGGFYAAGSFTQVAAVNHAGLAHILPDGRADLAFPTLVFASSAITNPTAQGVFLSPDHARLYFWGTFDHVNGQARNGLAAVNLSTETLDGFAPPVTSGSFFPIADVVDDGTHIYVSGLFSAIGGQTRTDLGRLSEAGVADSWNPTASSLSQPVKISLGAGGVVFLSGTFSISGVANVGRVKADGTLDTTWKPNPDAPVDAVARLDANRLVVGGSFQHINGAVANGLAVIDPSGTGAAVAPAPPAPALGVGSGTVRDIVLDGGEAYVLGSFTSMGATARTGLADFAPATGVLGPWNPSVFGIPESIADGSDGIVISSLVPSVANTVVRPFFAAQDNAGQILTTPVPDGVVNTLGLTPDAHELFLGGGFATLDGQPRGRLAAIDTATNTPTSFNGQADNDVSAIAMSADGTRMYAAGSFDHAGGSARAGIAAFDLPGGGLAGVTLAATKPPLVTRLLASPDGKSLYVLGTFTKLGNDDASRTNIGAIDTATGTAAAFNPPATSGITDIALSPDGKTLYVAGNFTTVGGHTTDHLAALDAATGAVLPGFTSDRPAAVRVTVSEDGASVFTQSNNSLFELDAATGAVRTWPVRVSADLGLIGALDFQRGALLSSGPGVDGKSWMTGTLNQFSFPAESRSAPAISGTAQAGQTVTCSQGAWFNAPTTFAYQWLLDGQAIAGQTSTSYAVADGDAGHALTCAVTASSAGGSATAASSAVTPAARPVTPVPAPVIHFTLKITAAKLSPNRFRVGKQRKDKRHKAHDGATASFSLNGAATAKLAVDAPNRGIRLKSRCVTNTKANRRKLGHKKKTKCALAYFSLSRSLKAGKAKVAISGRFGKHHTRLPTGRYRLTISAHDKSKHAARPVHLAFTVV